MAKSRSGSTSGDQTSMEGTNQSTAATKKAVEGSNSDGRTGGVKKQCEECGGASPVACRICSFCGYDFFGDKGDHNDSPSEQDDADSSFNSGERRRSERVKREKPDYYDALDFENNRRKGTPKRGQNKVERGVVGRGSPSQKPGRGRPPGRAKLTWKNTKGDEDDDDLHEKEKKKKRKRARQNRDQGENEEDVHMIDELTSEKMLQCKVSLSEVNRKLGVVMFQPV